MKFAITSDIHYPKEISRQTILYSKCGYTDTFYENLKISVQKLTKEIANAFILNGDFYWDLTAFSKPPIIPQDGQWNFFNMVLYQLVTFRTWLNSEIPLIIIEGNHDTWFDTFLYSEDGNAYVNKTHYLDFLVWHYKLKEDQAKLVINLLPKNSSDDNRFEIGTNIYLLRNSAKKIKDTIIYGLPYYNKNLESISWENFKEQILKEFQVNINKILKSKKKSSKPTKLIFISHTIPDQIDDFLNIFEDKRIDFKGFYWGHIHTMTKERNLEINAKGKFINIMPEMNNWVVLELKV